MPADKPLVSVIIPTYNRVDSLRRTLDSLSRQTYPLERYEVIVVDDGSGDRTPGIADAVYPFRFHYVRQQNQGDAAARNTGVRHSRAHVLVFVDDDIVVRQELLEGMVEVVDSTDPTLVVGTLLEPPDTDPILRPAADCSLAGNDGALDIDFTRCLSGFLAVTREAFAAIGGMQGLTRQGADAWCDVDFAYRAYLKGFQFRRSLKAVGYHHDAAAASLEALSRRWRNASRTAVLLFQKHPGLQSHISMFRDKTPIVISQDSPALIIDKLFHAFTAWRPVQWVMERLAYFLERVAPSPPALRPIYRWIISSYIYGGYREGLREYGPVPNSTSEEDSSEYA